MRLLDYLRRGNETQAAFSRRSGIPETTISRLIREGGANITTVELIREATDGAVTASDLGRIKRGKAA